MRIPFSSLSPPSGSTALVLSMASSTALLHQYPKPFLPRPPLSTALKRHIAKPNVPSRLRWAPISASTSPSTWDSEESRWLREEQRWLREEQRWLREESRWNSERESLLHEIADLRAKLEAVERMRPSADDDKMFATVEVLLRALKERAAPAPPPVLVEEADVKEMILEGSVDRDVDDNDGGDEEDKEEESRMLRKGSEGDDVRRMQEALERLGFYSGEEDIEYHMFGNGTDRAVKTWQASLGVAEDGVMTSELLKRLFVQPIGGISGLGVDEGVQVNGAPVSSVTQNIKDQKTVTKDNGNRGTEASPYRVFLLGENRWEEPSRLVNKDKPAMTNKDISLVKCLSCRGEGRLMCTECDGTGEPNIEPQFLEWIDEETKCPYCEGLGYTVCDVCEGKTLVDKQQS